jgi:hypothetical protein
MISEEVYGYLVEGCDGIVHLSAPNARTPDEEATA